MTRTGIAEGLLAGALWLGALTAHAEPSPAPSAAPNAAPKKTIDAGKIMRFRRFGDTTVYMPAGAPTRSALFLSGDGGWNQGVVDMAKLLVAKDYLVIGIDVPRYLATASMGKEKCVYPPGDLQALNQYIQKKLGIKRYLTPVLVGYSSGATLAYAALAAAPEGTFTGAISLGFCPDIDVKKRLCKGEGLEAKPRKKRGFDLAPFKNLPAPWFALHGKIDEVCKWQKTEAFVSATGANGHFLAIDKVGHGFAVQKRWQVNFEQAARDIAAASFRGKSKVAAAVPLVGNVSRDDVDVPIVEVPSDADGPKTDFMALLVSGDGGWAGLDREVSEALAEAGVPVVGIDSLQYFWGERTPEGAAADTQKLLTYYLKEWHRTKVIAIGYSFGADVLPFFLTRLPADVRSHVTQLVLISPSRKASFEFKVADWFGAESDDIPTLPVKPEVQKLGAIPTLCFYGKDDHGALCPELKNATTTIVGLDGNHRLAGEWQTLSNTMLHAIGVEPPKDE